jgi:WD40 repeat protein
LIFYIDVGCVEQNNIPICKCGIESTAIDSLTTVPSGSLLQTLNGHNSSVEGLTVLQNGDSASGSWDNTIKIWNPIDGTLKRTLNHDKDHDNLALTVLQNGDLASSDFYIKIWNPIHGILKRTLRLQPQRSVVFALTVLQNGDLVSGLCDVIKIFNPIDFSLKRTLNIQKYCVHALTVF